MAPPGSPLKFLVALAAKFSCERLKPSMRASFWASATGRLAGLTQLSFPGLESCFPMMPFREGPAGILVALSGGPAEVGALGPGLPLIAVPLLACDDEVAPRAALSGDPADDELEVVAGTNGKPLFGAPGGGATTGRFIRGSGFRPSPLSFCCTIIAGFGADASSWLDAVGSIFE